MRSVTREAFKRCRSRAVPIDKITPGTMYLIFAEYPNPTIEYCLCYNRTFRLTDSLIDYLKTWYFLREV